MSAYAHQMERELSGLTSRGNSEMGSRFSIESGCYMTSLAATIFIASLVTFGVLMVTLLIAISTMLQSCENKSSGIVQVQRLVDDYESLSYCRILSLHSKLNSLVEEEEEEDSSFEVPLLCRDVALQRIKQGVYLRELNFTIQMVLTYFKTIKPMNRDAVVMDIDDINLIEQAESYIEEAKKQRSKLTLELYSKLMSQGYSMILLSRRPERGRNSTVEQLKSRGYSDWSGLIMREDTREKEELERDNRIVGVIGNHMDVLTGQWSWQSKRLFKLPSLTYTDIFGLQ